MYKVVFITIDKEKVSAIWKVGRGGVEYLPNEWTTPLENCGPLAAFDNIYDANCFAIKYFEFANDVFRMNAYEIWECNIIKSTHEALWSPSLGKSEVGIRKYPEGTVFCDAIMLKNEVVNE